MTRFTKAFRSFALFTLGSSLYTPAPQISFYDRHQEGWFWYKDAPFEETTVDNDSKDQQKPKKPQTIEEKASAALTSYKKALEQKLHLALVSPTETNIKNYIALQKDMTERSDKFSKKWQQIVASYPEFNTEVKFPTSQVMRHVYEEKQRQKRESLIRSLSSSFGLFYFFKSDCAFCEAFSPIVRMFSDKYLWEVMAISIDGSKSSVFERSVQNNGIAEALGVKAIPALIAYNTNTKELIPISYAATSIDKLEENIMVLLGDGELE